MGPVGDPESVDGPSILQDLVDLVTQFLQVDDDSVTDDRELTGPHDSGRESVEFEHLVIHDDRVTCVVPALETDDEVGLLVKVVCNLSFPLVSPLGSDDS